MAAEFGDGLTRTASGRDTYHPDGLSLPSPRNNDSRLSGATARMSSPQADLSLPVPRNNESRFSGATARMSFPRGDQAVGSGENLSVPSGTSTPRASQNGHSLDPEKAAQSPLSDKSQGGPADMDEDIERQKSKHEAPPKDDAEQKDPNIVEWDGPDDPENPMNFPTWRKWMITASMGLMTFVITFASSVFSTATAATAEEFGVSEEVMILGTSLFVLGFAFGPIVWGPFSELYGRKIPLFFGFFVFAIFQIPVAVAQNVETIMLCRFFGGFFGSAPLAIVGGALADYFDPISRGIAVCVFAGATFIGPVAGPIVGGFVTMSYLGWRWTEYLTAIMGFGFGAIGFFIIPESFAPVLLSRRAKKLRFETKNWALHAKQDEKQVNVKAIAQTYLLKPFTMLVLEPILLLITLYMALIYGILYLFFEAYPIAFQEERGWNMGVGALPFISITIGVVIGSAFITWTTKTRFARKMEEAGDVVPEERLVPMIVGGAILPAGLFWFAWTSSPHITWVPQVLAGIPIGAGILMIFLQGLNYIIDVYKMHANSAIAANTFLRSWAGAGFPMFATAMYHTLGVNWATSLLGFLTVALAPVPVLFFIYGGKIRKMSKYSPS